MTSLLLPRALALTLLITSPLKAAVEGEWRFQHDQWERTRPTPAALPADALPLTRDGRFLYTILYRDDASAAEKFAAGEVAFHLAKITGLPISAKAQSSMTEKGPIIMIGRASSSNDLSSEAWVKEVDETGNLHLYGGSPRGTLYAVYHWLEEELGVEWWTPTQQNIPRNPTPSFSREKRHGKPAFDVRHISHHYAKERRARDQYDGRHFSPIRYDRGLFMARSRINTPENHVYQIAEEFGGDLRFGPPFHSHTYYLYIDPKKDFEKHPEWFSLINGKRTSAGGQLNVLDPGLREAFLKRLLENVKTVTQSEAALPSPSSLFFDVSPNDHEGYDEGAASREMVQREGTEMAPLLDFVNFLAQHVEQAAPHLFLRTLAYKATERPPKTLAARDNVIITLTDTESNPLHAIEAKEAPEANRRFLELIRQWKAKAKHLWIWDYANAYGIKGGSLPVPFARNLHRDLLTFHRTGVTGYQVEIGEPWQGHDRPFTYWIAAKSLEAPERPYSELEKRFTDGYYGPAGAVIRRYYAELEKAATSSRTEGNTFTAPLPFFDYLNLPFLVKTQALFDEAEAAVSAATAEQDALQRVRELRMSLDEAVLRLYPVSLRKEWTKETPLDLAHIRNRYRATLETIIRREVLPEHRKAWLDAIDKKLIAMDLRKEPIPPGLVQEGAQIYDYLPYQMAWSEQALTTPEGESIEVTPVEDGEADSGVAFEVTLKGLAPASLRWGYFGLTETRLQNAPLPEFKEGSYHWVKLGEIKAPTARGIAYLFGPASAIIGPLYFNSDYYPSLYRTAKERACDLWIKVRTLPTHGEERRYRICRAALTLPQP